MSFKARVLTLTIFLWIYQTVPGYPQGPGCAPSDTNCLFRSHWASGTGNSQTALRDGVWWDIAEWGGMPFNTTEINVVDNMTVPPPPGFSNSLRVQQQGSTDVNPEGWSRIVKSTFTPLSTDYYVRYYVRNDDDPNGTGFTCGVDFGDEPCSTT